MYRKFIALCATITLFVAAAPAFAQQITVVDTDITFNEAAGGFAYQNLPMGFPTDLTTDMYATGTLHQKVTVTATPGMRDTTISFCLVQTDRTPANRACTDPTALSFMATGEVTANQAVDTFDQAANLDLAATLAEVLVIAGDAAGNPVDSSNTAWDGSPDFSLYYPLTVSYEAVLVANGATFMGFPSDNVSMQVEAPTIDPPSGTYSDSVRVTLESATMDAEIRYTTDGSDPDETSSLYENPLTFTQDTELRVRAFKMDMDASDIVSANYTITIPTSGLRGRYYNGRNFGELRHTRTDSSIDFTWEGGESPAPDTDSNNFSVIWTGTIEPLYSETYTIKTVNDDGVRLWVNNELIIDDWEFHGPQEQAGNITLQAGQKYDIWMEYFNGGGAGTARLLWVSGTQPEEVIPDSQTTPTPNDNTAFVSLLLDEEDSEIAETITDPIALEIKRRGALDSEVTVNVSFSGTATNGEDYEMVASSVTIPAGELEATIEIMPIVDGEVEGEEEIVITLTDGNGYSLAEPLTQTITLLDFDTESFPIAGEVLYTGEEMGNIFVEAFTDDDEEFQKLRTMLTAPGPFSLSAGEGEYQVVAFLDTNGNERLDNDELWVQNVDEQNFPVYYTPPVTDLVLNLDRARIGDTPPEMSDGGSSDDGGCATAGSGSAAGLVLLVLVGLMRRRRS